MQDPVERRGRPPRRGATGPGRSTSTWGARLADGRAPFDAVVLLALLGASYWARRGSLPYDGLWFDDSWVATGVIHGHPRQLLIVGSAHPGFTASLMALDRLGFGSARDLGIPSLVAGVIAAPLLYVALRRAHLHRSVAALAAAALVVAPIPIMYAGRVKGYTLDTVFVLALTIAIPVVARRSWSWWSALAWAGAMVAVGTFSGYLVVASVAATATVVLHPEGDRVRRVAAGAAQAVVQAVLVRAAQARTDLAAVERVMEDAYDAHMALSVRPWSLARELVRHLGRIAEVYPGGSGPWMSALALAALAGLIMGAWRGRSRPEALAARFLLIALGLAAAGSFADRFPFGPTNDGIAVGSAGGRHALWMVPIFAFGLAILASRVRHLAGQTSLGSRPLPRMALDIVVVVAALVVVVVRYEPAPPPPYQGSTSATRSIDRERGPNDLVLVDGTALFQYANDTTTPLHLVATPTHQVGYAPVFEDRRVLGTSGWSATEPSPPQIRAAARGRDRVFVYGSGGLYGERTRLGDLLRKEGFTLVDTALFEWSIVDVWARPGAQL